MDVLFRTKSFSASAPLSIKRKILKVQLSDMWKETKKKAEELVKKPIDHLMEVTSNNTSIEVSLKSVDKGASARGEFKPNGTLFWKYV